MLLGIDVGTGVRGPRWSAVLREIGGVEDGC